MQMQAYAPRIAFFFCGPYTHCNPTPSEVVIVTPDEFLRYQQSDLIKLANEFNQKTYYNAATYAQAVITDIEDLRDHLAEQGIEDEEFESLC
jgi:hypothetical protein